jgi:hypothetical protein
VAQSQLEREERPEIGYVPETKGRFLVLKKRLYMDEWSTSHSSFRNCRYRNRTSKRLVASLDRREVSAKPLDRTKSPSVRIKAPGIPKSVISAVGKMIELLELPPGWNSYNAKPISKENVNFALRVLSQTMRANTPAPTVVPMVRGGVQLEWHTRGINLELSIYSPTKVSFFAEDVRGGKTAEGEKFDLAVLARWFDQLSR